MQKNTIITLVVTALFVLGAGAIIYYGRPVMELREREETELQVTQNNKNDQEETEGSETEGSETSEQEASENTASENTATGAKITPTTQTPSSSTSTTTKDSTPTPGIYTSAQVASHATESDCWSIVDGNVYDLTSWVSRHPGGSRAIVGMCGIDASSNFSRQHSRSSAAKASLALLKIGVLAK